MLEFVTEPSVSEPEVLSQLHDLHTFTYQHLEKELLWAASMPCQLGAHLSAAEYGSSNSGMLKTIYRLGLSQRYGRNLSIAGIHYNFSLGDEFWLFLKEKKQARHPFSNLKIRLTFI